MWEGSLRAAFKIIVQKKPDRTAESDFSHSKMETVEAAEVKPVAKEHHEEKTKSSESLFHAVTPEEEQKLEVLPASKHAQHHHHHIDIDANTPVDAVRAPGCFNRLKEEVEAVVETIAEKLHLKKPPS
ncbi:hypothetical protein R1flu_019842 [Riccia fluitans]|uniref:Uncharacterized protein n=1 Tax=Riccia fluitans TaxID=41844 RepID=A0ABD1ZNA9_9MARC